MGKREVEEVAPCRIAMREKGSEDAGKHEVHENLSENGKRSEWSKSERDENEWNTCKRNLYKKIHAKCYKNDRNTQK